MTIGPAPNWQKIGKRSKAKGNAFERKIAKFLSEFTNLSFCRTPASGGTHWEGDIILRDHPMWNSTVIIECKHRRINLEKEILSSFATLETWRRQYGDNKMVFIVFSTEHGKTLVYCDDSICIASSCFWYLCYNTSAFQAFLFTLEKFAELIESVYRLSKHWKE